MGILLTSCTPKDELLDEKAQESELIKLREMNDEYKEQISVLEQEMSLLKESNDDAMVEIQDKLTEKNEKIEILSYELNRLNNELDKINDELTHIEWWHRYFASNVQGYFDDNASNIFVGELVNVGDQISELSVTNVDKYKSDFQVITFEGNVSITGIFSILEINSETYGYIEPDVESLNRLPRFFDMNSSGFRINNATEFIDQLKDKEGLEITIIIDKYEIGNFPSGWAASSNMCEILE